MAIAHLPPTGPLHDSEVLRQRQQIAQVDPVERWKLREESTSDNLNKAAAALVKRASRNRATADYIRGRNL